MKPKEKSFIGPAGFPSEFYQTFEEKHQHPLFQKIKEEGTLVNLFYETNNTLKPKLDKNKKEL